MFSGLKTKAQESGPLFSAPMTQERRRSERWLADRLEKAKKQGFFCEPDPITVTPVLAEIVLIRNRPDNRRLRRAKVERMIRALRDGRWLVTAQGVSFDADGFLDNGQHRLTAIVESGIAAQMCFAFGHSPEVFAVLDTQTARTAADMLRRDGEEYAPVLASVTRMLKAIEAGQPRSNLSFDNDEIRTFIPSFPNLRESCRFANLGSKLKCAPTPIVAAHYLIAETGVDEKKINEFFDKLGSGLGLMVETDPINKLRKAISTSPGKGKWGARVEIAALTIKAWNLWIAGRRTRGIEWNGDETFPVALAR